MTAMDTGGYGDIRFIDPNQSEPQERLEDDPAAGIRLDPLEIQLRQAEDSALDQQAGSGYMAGDVFKLFHPDYTESTEPIIMPNPTLGQAPEVDSGLTGSYNQQDPIVKRVRGRGERERIAKPSKKFFSKKPDRNDSDQILKNLFSFLNPAERENPDAREKVLRTRRLPYAPYSEDSYRLISKDFQEGVPIDPSDGVCTRCGGASDVILCKSCCGELDRKDKEIRDLFKSHEFASKDEENERANGEPPSGLFDDQPNQYETEEQEP